jgi:hypothetical protein
MNEKIKQLAEKADWRFSDKITGDELQPILDKRLEKFAELIVKECVGFKALVTEVPTEEYIDGVKTNPDVVRGMNLGILLAYRYIEAVTGVKLKVEE